jgi:hypothetical protein
LDNIDYDMCAVCAGCGSLGNNPCHYCDGIGTFPSTAVFRKAVSQFLDRHGERGAKAMADMFAPAMAAFLGDAEPHQMMRRRVMHWMIVYQEKAA